MVRYRLSLRLRKHVLRQVELLQKLRRAKKRHAREESRWLDFLPFKLLDTIRKDAERLIVDVNAQDQFWTSAGDILIDVVNKHPEIGKPVHDVIAAGGDIEIAAHNELAGITITSVKPSGQRQILFDSRRRDWPTTSSATRHSLNSMQPGEKKSRTGIHAEQIKKTNLIRFVGDRNCQPVRRVDRRCWLGLGGGVGAFLV